MLALFATTGVCVFQDMLALDVVDRLHEAYARRAQEVDAGLMACTADLDTQFRYNEVIRRRAARYDFWFPTSAATLQGEDEPWMSFVHAALGENAATLTPTSTLTLNLTLTPTPTPTATLTLILAPSPIAPITLTRRECCRVLARRRGQSAGLDSAGLAPRRPTPL